MADNTPVLIHFEPGAVLPYPLSNSYAEHIVLDSRACRKLCNKINSNPTTINLYTDADAAECTLAAAPAFKAVHGYGPITVNGFGIVDGKAMMQAFKFQDKIVWPAQDTLPLNGYGNAVNSFKTIANAEAHTRWRISSGLLELSSGAAPTAMFPFAVDVSEVTVGWGAKRGDGAVRLQFNRVPLGGISDKPESNNQPARLYDVKTPGTWVGASDGPRVTADGSELGYLYLHHSDDNLKIDSTA
eukprot:gene19520-30336_t